MKLIIKQKNYRGTTILIIVSTSIHELFPEWDRDFEGNLLLKTEGLEWTVDYLNYTGRQSYKILDRNQWIRIKIFARV